VLALFILKRTGVAIAYDFDMRFICLLLTSIVLGGCSDPCTNTVIEEISSPDGKLIATAFIRDCGATTDFSPQVSLRKAGEPRPKNGNVFIGNHSQKIDLRWASKTHLRIETDAVVVKEMTAFEGVTVERKATH
jgi:hypothetical protein